MKNITYSIALLTMNLMHHNKHIEKYSNSPFLEDQLKHHMEKRDDLERALKILMS